MNKFFIVLKREYLTRVKKKSFILMSLLMPLLFLIIMVLPAIIMSFSKDTSDRTVMVIDQTGKYFQYFEDTDYVKFIEGNGKLGDYRQNQTDSIYAYVLIKEDLLKNPAALSIQSPKQITAELESIIRSDLEPVLREQKLHSFNIPNLDDIIRDSNISLKISTIRWDKSGEDKSGNTIIASSLGFILVMVIYFFIMTYGAVVMQGVREEKKNRIVEVIISSIKPRTLLFGKVSAIGLVGLTQMLIIGVSVSILFFIAMFIMTGTISFDSAMQTAEIAMSMESSDSLDFYQVLEPLLSINFFYIISIFLIFFVLGYYMYASVYAACGAAVSTDEEASQMMMPMSMIMLIGFFIGIYSMDNPNGGLAIFGSLFPITSPIVMMMRLPFDPPVWQLILSIVILILSTIGFVWVAEKIYQVGLLMYGKKPSMKELWNWLRQK